MEDRGKKEANELILNHNSGYDWEPTVKFFKLSIIDRFRRNDKIIISCNRQSLRLVNIAIDETRHMGYLQGQRSGVTIKENGREVEQIKIPLELIKACVELNKERKDYD